MHKFVRIFNTVKYLKSKQINYRFYYLLRSKLRKLSGFTYPLEIRSESVLLNLYPSIASYPAWNENGFVFLNLSHVFENTIDWNFSEYGKLWTYNLNYFDFLQQEKMSREVGLALICDFIEQSASIKDGFEPFPIALRGINWVKFLNNHQIKDKKIDDSLYAQYKILMDNLEYHLLGNHLLENGFSLLFGAYYFKDEKLSAKAVEILTSELEEQILDDGAHFELSPMYHQIMLFRVFDCFNLVKNNPWIVDNGRLMEFLKEKAIVMSAWLNVMTFENGDIPLFNDSAKGIAPTTKQLNDYASRLDLNHQPSTMSHPLSVCGYRKITKPHYECFIDVGPIGPDYIPGHAHADTFNFEIRIQSPTTNHDHIHHSPPTIHYQPFIVDTGLSTYETNARRMTERSTAAHNTVEIEGKNSSEVWGGFRVAKRAKIVGLVENDNTITATHDGYKKLGILHTRTWNFGEERIIIEDSLSKACHAVARLHFHPNVTEAMIKKHITIDHQPLTNHQSRIINYTYAPEFNKTQKALVMEIPFKEKLKVEIKI